MTAPSPALHAQLRPVIGAQLINLGLCVSLLSVAFALRDSISPAVWVRSTIILIVGLLMLWCGKEMRRGRRWAYVRAKWIAVLGTIGFVGVAALPGPFPAWMRIEQGTQALVFLALTWMLTRPALALFFPRVNARMIHTEKPIPLSDASARDASLDYLRAFIVLLVLLHHSVLAYAIMWPAPPRTFTILTAPIVDPQRWAGFDVLAIFNDTFFMALMFLLSGLFAWPSLERKGGAKFLRDRILRLGVPFAVAAGILMPLAYYPSYAVTGADPGFLAYSSAWLSLGVWPSGPAWFIWLLLVFDAVAAGLHVLGRRWMAKKAGPTSAGIRCHAPRRFSTGLCANGIGLRRRALAHARSLFISGEPPVALCDLLSSRYPDGRLWHRVWLSRAECRAGAEMADLALGRACRLCVTARHHHNARPAGSRRSSAPASHPAPS